MQLLDLVILLLVAFVPSLIYLVWIRDTERFSREPWGRLVRVFAFGATISIIISIAAELLLMLLYTSNVERVYELFGKDPNIGTLVLACVIAPLVEELAKGLGVFRVGKRMSDVEDGIVYGAAAGLGFAATENMLYEFEALVSGGAAAFLATAIVRIFSSALLHASASSVFGLGIARKALQGRSWAKYYIGAAVMHSAFNLFASFGVLMQGQLGDMADLIGFVAAFAIAITAIRLVRAKIRSLERSETKHGPGYQQPRA
jgi:RsiW-degrading membrane proteinase PrsW (M82 family)